MSGGPLLLELKRRGKAYLLEHSEDFVTLASSAPSPPGSTLEASYSCGVRSVSLRVKVRSCRREPLPDGEAGYRIDGRLVGLTRGDREVLFGSHGETDPGSSSET
ncbi:MAG TPA: hypothetical protein VJN18_18985 [Polyangiaceae bacterium]|nr:hypothetical protein [Polyangiaceae bacterium]